MAIFLIFAINIRLVPVFLRLCLAEVGAGGTLVETEGEEVDGGYYLVQDVGLGVLVVLPVGVGGEKVNLHRDAV